MLDRTDSYCERCGSRYAFRANAPKNLSLKGALVLAKGIKNFVLTDGQSMNDSIALARNEDEHDGTTRMTEAFHRTFNFCMTCRQYACSKCWNAREGACLTCAPEPGYEPVALDDHLIVRTPAAHGDSDWALFPEILGRGANGRSDTALAASEWPTQDLDVTSSDANSGANGNGAGNHPSRAQAIQEAWSLWPIADELAPEMTLTPEELMLVEAELSHEEQTESATPNGAGVPQTLPGAAGPETWSLGAAPTTPVERPAEIVDLPIELTAGDLEIPAELEAGVAQADVAPSGIAAAPAEQVELAAAASAGAPAAEPVARPIAEAVTPISAPTHERQTGRRLLGRLGRAMSIPQASADDVPPTPGQLVRDPWPRVTAWADRPIVIIDWWADVEPATTAQSSTELRVDQATTSVETTLAAATSASTEPVAPAYLAAANVAAFPPDAIPPEGNQQTLFGAIGAPDANAALAQEGAAVVASAPQQPAAPEAVVPARPAHATGPADASTPSHTSPPTREPREPSAWPPLGASWPAQTTPGAPWPAPNIPAVPAVVAARETAGPVPVIAEMWAQSAQEVLNRGTVRVCHHCALPVSTQARFCRRCGTRQA